jgi:outer membrane protein OmpA-like peptidoglycan-associated protein
MNRFLITVTFAFGASISILLAQNLVSNPGFERVKKMPTNWSANEDDFHNYIFDWTSPNGGSPDLFFVGNMGSFMPRPNVDVQVHAPRSGKYMVGIKTFGCAHTMHCKEYLQTKLKMPLEAGKEYYIEYWVNPIVTSAKVNNFGIYFSEEPLSGGDGEEAIWKRPEFQLTSVVDLPPNEWARVSGRFIAGCDCTYMVIGNFNMDEFTTAKREETDLEYSYYMVDDVTVRLLNAKPTPLKMRAIEVGNTIQLDKVFFNWDDATILPTSAVQLKDLIAILKQYPTMRIEIRGHTDATGTHDYNIALSEQRSAAVQQYLLDNGIQESRLRCVGLGETQPIGDNENESGRKLNRRVEFLILDK